MRDLKLGAKTAIVRAVDKNGQAIIGDDAVSTSVCAVLHFDKETNIRALLGFIAKNGYEGNILNLGTEIEADILRVTAAVTSAAMKCTEEIDQLTLAYLFGLYVLNVFHGHAFTEPSFWRIVANEDEEFETVFAKYAARKAE